jgi:hypothetical protein
VNIDAEQSLRLSAAKSGLGILKIGNQRKTAPVIGLAVERWADVPRGALQESHPEPGLDLLHRIGDRRPNCSGVSASRIC